MIGLFFLLSFSKAVSCLAEMDSRNEKFMFIFEDSETAEDLAEGSSFYGIACESRITEEENLTEASADRQERAGLVVMKEMDSMSYPIIMDYFQNHDGKLEMDLLKWVQRAALLLFIGGTIILFLTAQGKEKGKRSKGICSGVLILIWLVYMKCIPGSFHFPAWAFPGKCSDFEGWKELGESIGKQMFSMRQYKSIEEVGQCSEAMYGALGFLLLSLALLFLYRFLCAKLPYEMLLHIALSVLAMGIYIFGSNPQMKGIIYFFPCYLLSGEITKSSL
ncbi:MAG: hypothetical protein KH828_08250 [Clostridiales bacterium]|nr:hypothetical protein [Clostridiales bacterium]